MGILAFAIKVGAAVSQRKIAGDKRGVAAIEFAIILPIMITLFMGVVEFSQVIDADRRATSAAAAVADLTAQVSTVNATEINNIFDASEAVMAPFDSNNLSIVLTMVEIDGDGNATVEWSCASGSGAQRPADSTVPLPDALLVPETGVVMAEVSFKQPSLVNGYFAAEYDLTDKTYFRPRITDVVRWDNSGGAC